jgi:transcriptional regulator with XRE-family HTH domain
MRDEHQASIGSLIAGLREQQGWSQRELAKAVGLDQSAVSRIEAGRRRVSASELQRLADLFSVSADQLLTSRAATESAPPQAWTVSSVTQAPGEASARTGSPEELRLQSAIRQATGQAPAGASGGEESPASRPGRAPRGGASPALELPTTPAARAFSREEEDFGLGEARVHGLADGLTLEHGDISAGPADADVWDDDEPSPSLSQPLVRPAAPSVPPPARAHWERQTVFGAEPPSQAPSFSAAPAPAAGEWSSAIAGVVRDWFALRALAARPSPTLLWSSGQTAEGKPAYSPQPWRPPATTPGTGDALYDRVARFWRSELHVDPDDGPLPDLVPLLEDGLGIQIIVARVAHEERAPATSPADDQPSATGSALRPVAAAFVTDGVPFLFVNAARPVVLQRFALAHGFAHLMLAHGDVVDERIGWSRANPREAAANDFAEELLAPVRAVERWYARRPDLPKNPTTLDTLLELGNAFGISAWASLFRTRAAGRLSPRQFSLLRREMRRDEWQLLPRQAFLGGVRDTLAHLTPQEVLPPGSFGEPAVLRVPASMRAWALAAVRDGRLSLEDAAAALCLETSALAQALAHLGLE